MPSIPRSLLLLALGLWPSLALAASVQLTWDYTQNTQNPGTGFVVERCTGTSCSNFVAITPSPLPIATTTFNDTSVQPATSYRWQVRAVNAQGDQSAPSNAVSFLVPLPGMSAPVNLRGSIVP